MTRYRPAPPPVTGLVTSWQHQAAEHLPSPVLLIGGDGAVESCNQAARLHFGLELTARPYAELVAPESAVVLGAAVRGVLRGESPADTRLSYHTTAGFQTMESRFYPFTKDKRIQGCIVSSTVLVGTEGDAEGGERRVQHLLEGLTDAFFSLDDEGRFSYLNMQAQRLLGRPSAELLGRQLLEVFGEFGVESGPWLGALGSRTPGVFEAFYGPQRSWLEVHTYPTDAGLIVYLHDVTQRRGVQQALRRAHDELEERVRARTEELEEPFRIGEHQLSISASVGIVPSELGYSSAEAVLRDADIAMYRAKIGGKAQHRLFGPAMRDEAVRRLDLETDLRAALAQGALEVAYQPIAAIATGELVGFEALARRPIRATATSPRTSLFRSPKRSG